MKSTYDARKARAVALDFDIDVVEPPPVEPADIARLKKLCKKGIAFEALCDALGTSPAKTRDMLERAREGGALLQVVHDNVLFRSDEPRDDIQETEVAPTVGAPTKIGVMSDLHIGSKYCLYGPMTEFVNHAYAEGVRAILLGGDSIDGDYPSHGYHELTHVGLDHQVELMARRLPQKQGLTYHGITGNHDLTFESTNGVNVSKAMLHAFARAGRKDLSLYGNRGAYVRIGGVVVHLWHPSGGGSYAVSYPMQKKVESYSPGEKPQVLLVGHWHKYAHILDRGVHALAIPTFQGGGSAFAKSLRGTTAIGGLILEWSLTAAGTIRSFRHEVRQYFERERVAEV
jgi:predicted phosphodiesterase